MRAGIPAACAIRTLADLVELLKQLRAAVAEGALSQIWPDQRPWASKEALADLPESGPLPDYLEMYFRERDTESTYRLAVETYHGAGGTWEQIGLDAR